MVARKSVVQRKGDMPGTFVVFFWGAAPPAAIISIGPNCAKLIGDYMQTHGGLIWPPETSRVSRHVWAAPPLKTDYRRVTKFYKAGFLTQGPAMIEEFETSLKAMIESDGP